MVLLMVSCVADGEFDLPKSAVIPEVNLETNTDLNAILGATFQNSVDKEITTFETDLIFDAYVVSSDEAGNFYKELILQDAPENPTAGIAVQINLASYFETFDFGRKVYVKLKGLSIGELNGVQVLGLVNGKTIEPIPLSQIQNYIIRTPEVAEIVPLPIKAIEFNDQKENLYVQLQNVQFPEFLINPENPFTFASENNDEFDGERRLESCARDYSFVLSTSTFADFKSFQLPEGSGFVNGILTRDFYDDFFTIYLNSPEDIYFTEARCDPEIFDCGKAENTGEIILFQEDFEVGKNNKPVAGNGWKNFVQEGSEPWEYFVATGENASLGRSARVQISGTGDYKSVAWLITPKINFDRQEGEVLQFKSSTSFANNSTLQVLFSNDWDGKIENFETATWKILSSAYVAQNSDFFGDWMPSGKVDLSCAEGWGYIAFKYTGSDLDYYDGIYELDDVLISSK